MLLSVIGYGGFPSPIKTLKACGSSLFRRVFLDRRHATSQSNGTDAEEPAGSVSQNIRTRPVPYLSFDATVGKNSSFQNLSQEQKEEIGGLELRALNLLAIIVPSYWFGLQILALVILAPYMARQEFRAALTTSDGQAAPVNSTW